MRKILLLAVMLVTGVSGTLACKCGAIDFKIKDTAKLRQYDFIARVKIGKMDTVPPIDNSKFDGEFGRWHIEVLEQFKGDTTSIIYDQTVFTSCSRNIETGDEWLLFGTRINGMLTILPCRHDVPMMYRSGVKNPWGANATDLLTRLRKLYGHPEVNASIFFPKRDAGTGHAQLPLVLLTLVACQINPWSRKLPRSS